MSQLRSHPLYAATAAFLNRAQGKPQQNPGGSPNRSGGSTALAVAASGFSGTVAVEADYWRVCRPFRPCPQGWPAGYATVPIQSAGAGGSVGGSIGSATGIGGVAAGMVVDDGSITVTQPSFADAMKNSELDRYWRIWNELGGSAEGSTGFNLVANDFNPPTPSGLCAYLGATFADATTAARLLSAPVPSSAGVFARGSFTGGLFNGYVVYENATEYTLAKVVNNVATSLASAVVTPAINDLVAIQCTGTTIGVRINGALVTTVIDATFANGYSGLSLLNVSTSMLFGDAAIG